MQEITLACTIPVAKAHEKTRLDQRRVIVRLIQRPKIEYETRCASSVVFSGGTTGARTLESVKWDRSRKGSARFSKAFAIRAIWVASSSVTADGFTETRRSR